MTKVFNNEMAGPLCKPKFDQRQDKSNRHMNRNPQIKQLKLHPTPHPPTHTLRKKEKKKQPIQVAAALQQLKLQYIVIVIHLLVEYYDIHGQYSIFSTGNQN